MSFTSTGYLPLYDKNGHALPDDTRIAVNYDDELMVGRVSYDDGLPYLAFDQPTHTGVLRVRVLHQNTEGQLDITVIQPRLPMSFSELQGSPTYLGMVAQDMPEPEFVDNSFLFEVTRITDTKTGMGISLEEVLDKHYHSENGPGHLTIGSTDKSLFDGYGPGDQVLVTLQLATTTPHV